MKTYREKLLDPRWQKKRLEVFERDSFQCVNCGAEDRTLHVHHKKYASGDPWDSPLDDLETRCGECHEEITKLMREVRALLTEANDYLLANICGFLRASAALPCDDIAVRDYGEAEGVGLAFDMLAEEVLAAAGEGKSVRAETLESIRVSRLPVRRKRREAL